MTGARLDGVDAEREAQLLSRVIDTISGGLDLGRMLQGVARLVTETTGTDVCFVHLLDEQGRTLRLQGATPPFDTLVGEIELGLGEGVSGWVASHCEPAVIVDDKTADPRYRYIPALRGEEFTSMASVPIVTPLGHLVGVLNVHTRLRREFTAADTELLRSVAGLVAGAIENARLHRRLAEREEALEQFAEQTVEWQEHERRRLAGEIHDGISQRIVSLFFHLSAAADAIPGDPETAAEQVALAQELATAALDETRSAIAGLRPPILDDLGLAASLERTAARMAKPGSIRFPFHDGLVSPNGTLAFFDFEYFGWDDPVKLTADFMLHPAVALSATQRLRIRRSAEQLYRDGSGFAQRLGAYLHLFGLRWVLILLNEFISDRWRQRVCAGASESWVEAKAMQLAYAVDFWRRCVTRWRARRWPRAPKPCKRLSSQLHRSMSARNICASWSCARSRAGAGACRFVDVSDRDHARAV